jgi:hypothetical protein
MPEPLKFIITSEAWLTRLIQETRTDIRQFAPDSSKEEMGGLISDTLTALIKIIDFAPGQKTDITKLRQTLLGGRLGQTINIVCIHCMAFINSPSEGIVVSNTAEDILMEDEKGKKFLVSQRDRLDAFEAFALILNDSKIAHDIKLVVIDDDKLVTPGQKENVVAFLQSLEEVVSRHPVSKHSLEIVRGSRLIERNDFTAEWQRRSDRSNTVAERLVDSEFEKLKQKPLPGSWKTRERAREVAQKSFLNQFALGATIPKTFDPAIILQRSNAHQQSTEIFNLGNQGKGKPPLIFSFWKDRKLV